MDNLKEDDKIQVESKPSQPSNVGSASEPATISPKKPIQLGIVQSSIGSRGAVSGTTKKSRWDQGPVPGEVEGESTVEQSQTIENLNSVKDLVKKFEGISGVSSVSNEAEKDEGEEKDDHSEHAVSPTPTRIKLVRTNFLKEEKPEEAVIEVNTTLIPLSLSKPNKTTEKPEKPAKEENTTQVSANLSKPNETDIKLEINKEIKKEKSEASELKSVTKSKALQIISCNYDSETDESSQDSDSSTARHGKTSKGFTSLARLSDIHTSSELKDDKVGERLALVTETEKKTQMDIDENYQKEPSIENTQSTPTVVIEFENIEGKPSQTDPDKKCYGSDEENSTNTYDMDKIDKNNTTSEQIVYDLNPEKLKPADEIISEKSNIETDSLCDFGPEATSGDNNEDEHIAETTNIQKDHATLNEERNKMRVQDKSSEEFEEKSDEVNSCVSSDSNTEIAEKSKITENKKKLDDVGIDQSSPEISQSDKGIHKTESLSKTLDITIDVATSSENVDDVNQDWVIVSKDDVQEMISEEPVKSTTLDVSHDLETLNVSNSGGGKSLTCSLNSEIVSTSNSKETNISKLYEKMDTLTSGKNDELEVLLGKATNPLDDNLQSFNEDSQTKDSLTEIGSKYSDKLDERMEEIFSENFESSSIPEISEKESNDEEAKSLESEKTNQEITYFKGIIETEKHQDNFVQSSGLGDLETDETLLEMLESDDSPHTTAVTDTTMPNKILSSSVNIVKDDSLPEQLKVNASIGVGKSACVANITDVISKETVDIKSVTCMSTTSEIESRNIDKNTCSSKEPVDILKNVEGHKNVKEISSAEYVEPHHLVINEIQSDKDTSFKDSILSESSTVSEFTNNKLDDITTQGNIVEGIAEEEMENKLSEKEKVLVNLDLEKDLKVFDKAIVSKEDMVTKNESLDTEKIISVACLESNPSTVAEDKKLETNDIKSDILSDPNEPTEKTVINYMPMETVHTFEEEHIPSKDQTAGKSNDQDKRNVLPTPEVKHTSSEETTVQNSYNFLTKDVGTVSFTLSKETVEEPQKFVDSSTKSSVTDSEKITEPEDKSKTKDSMEQAIEEMSAPKSVTKNNKSEILADIPKRNIIDEVVAKVSDKSEEHVQEIVSALHATSSKDIRLPLIPDMDSCTNNVKAVEDLSTVSELDYSEKKMSIDVIVESEEIKKEDPSTTKETIILKIEDKPSKHKDKKTQNPNIPEQNTEQDNLKDDVNLTHEHMKADDSETPVIVEVDLHIDHTKQHLETSSSKTDIKSLREQMVKEHTSTSNVISTTFSEEIRSTSKDSLPSVFPNPNNFNFPNSSFSEGDDNKGPVYQPSTSVSLEKDDQHFSQSSHAKTVSKSPENIVEPSTVSDKVIMKPSAESSEQKLDSLTLDTPEIENLNQVEVASLSALDSSEPETVEAIDSFLKQTESPKEAVKVVKSTSISPNLAEFPAEVLCEPTEKLITDAIYKNISPVKVTEKELMVAASDQPNTLSLNTSCDVVKDKGSSFDTVRDDNNESDANDYSCKSTDFGNSLKINIATTSAASPDVHKKTSVQITKNIQVREKPVEPLKLKIKKTDFEVYSPKRSESPVESLKETKTIAGNKSAENVTSVGKPDLEQGKETQKNILINNPQPIENALKDKASNEKGRNENTLSKSVVSVDESITPVDIEPPAIVPDRKVECISRLDTSKINIVEKSTSDRVLTTEDTHVRPGATENVAEDEEESSLVKHHTNRPADSLNDSSNDSSTAKSARKKLKRTQTESKNLIEENEPLKGDSKSEISSDLSPVTSKIVMHSQFPESEVKQSPKVTPKELPPVRVSARQKQRQAVAAALAAEEKSKDPKHPVETSSKKIISQEKIVDKKAKQSVSPTKEVGLKALFVKTTETANNTLPPGEKSPKLVESKSPSPISPKVAKELGQEKLEPITLKLSKEDNPVIIRSSSLSPKKMLSPQSPQQKSLGYTLKIAKDSAIIVPKDPSHSPKLKEPSASAISSKADVTNKVGYLIKDTGLTITPVSSAETQEQKLNKITLKLSKAGGHPEIKQEKAETWKAITKLGEVDIVPMEGKVSAESSKRKERFDQGSPEKRMKVGDLTIEPSTSSGLSKLQGLLTQAPLNKAESSEDVQFVGFGSPPETSKPGEKLQYDIGLVKPEDELSLPKKRGRPRKITSPSEIVHSVTHSGLAASKSILAASLQHQTLQQHIHQQKNLQVQQSTPQEEADSAIPMFPVPLFDLSDDTFMEPHPTIFPEQVQPETIIMRSARGRPIGRSRRPRGSGLPRGERGGK